MHLRTLPSLVIAGAAMALTAQADTPPSFLFTALTKTAGDTPSDIAVLDIDGDGFLDVISAGNGQQGGSAELTVKLGDGTGSFPGEETVNGIYLEGFDVADFDEDGTLDLITCGGSYYSGTLQMRFLKGLGNGKFSYGPLQALTGKPADIMHDVAAGDFNEDGHLDVFVVGDFSCSVWLGAGDGSFTPAPTFPYAYAQRTARAFDFDADGHVDVAAGGKIYLGLGDGTFGPNATGTSGRWGSLADVDRDGLMDIVAVQVFAFEDYTVALNNGDGTFTAVAGGNFAAGTEVRWGALGDFNADAIPDLVVSDKTTDSLFIKPGLGAGHFGDTISLPVSSHAGPVATGDFTGDGLDDIVALTGYADNEPNLYTFTSTSTPSDWTGKAGHSGIPYLGSPSLVGCGAITGGGALTLELSHTFSATASWFLVVGGLEVSVPLFEGLLIPSPDIVVALTADAAGEAIVPITWPTGLPSGTQLLFQAWVVHTLSPLSITSSSALLGTQQ